MTTSRSKSSKSRKGTSSRGAGVSRRSKTVWGALLASMTLVGGLLVVLDPKQAPSGGGFALPPLAATDGASSVEAVFNTKAPLESGRWQAIVIHDSGSPAGSPESLDEAARRSGLRGLGYHFVIGNGNGLRDGQVHVASRWLQQGMGAHVAGQNGDWYNRNAIGICLVGNGERTPFTDAQMSRLVQLVDALQRECRIPADRVYLHSQLAATPSPGRFFADSAFRSQLPAIR